MLPRRSQAGRYGSAEVVFGGLVANAVTGLEPAPDCSL